jgi:hypothetical protein
VQQRWPRVESVKEEEGEEEEEEDDDTGLTQIVSTLLAGASRNARRW